MSLAGSRVHRWFSHISIPEAYALCVALLFIAWLLYSVWRHGWSWCREEHRQDRRKWRLRLAKLWWRRFSYSMLQMLTWVDIPTWSQASVLAMMLAGNIVALSFRATSWTMVQNRAGWLAVINIAPLCTGLNFGLPSDLFYVDRHSFAWFHRWTGRIFVFHSLLHGISAASRVHLSVVTSPRYLLPILVSYI